MINTHKEFSSEQIFQLGWADFILNQEQIEELNRQMQKYAADTRKELKSRLNGELEQN